jgi:hypothetical protein
VIVFAGREVGPVDAQFAGHAKMKAEPGATGEAEQHLFTVRLGGEQCGARETTLQLAEVRLMEEPLFAVEFHAENLCAETGVPLFAVKLDLGQFGHGVMAR